MKVLVTGANGYIGSHIVSKLLKNGHEVFAADIAFNNLDSRVKQITTSIFDCDETIYEKTGSPDVCIHMAWRNGFQHNADSHVTDLPGHYLFIKNMIAGGLKHIAVMGSMHEVGYWEGAIDENTPTNPKSPYGIAKNTLRQLTEVLTSNTDVCLQWIRGYYILGDDLKNHSIFTKLYEASLEGKEEFPFTSGKNKYDFLDVSELAKQIVAVVEQTKIKGIINCCSGKPVSLAEKVEQYIKEKNLNIKLKYGAYPDRPYDSPGIWGNPDKINCILGK